MMIPVPEKAVSVLSDMHDKWGKADIQTIRGGTQVGLRDCPYEAVSELIKTLEGVIGIPITDAWSIRMSKGGYHIEHNHPKGKLSGVYYLTVGEGADLVVGDQIITPQAGLLVLFPSWLPHSTTIYRDERPRLTVAFDI